MWLVIFRTYLVLDIIFFSGFLLSLSLSLSLSQGRDYFDINCIMIEYPNLFHLLVFGFVYISFGIIFLLTQFCPFYRIWGTTFKVFPLLNFTSNVIFKELRRYNMKWNLFFLIIKEHEYAVLDPLLVLTVL